MSRRRFRWDPEANALVEVGAEWDDAPRSTGDLGKFEYDNLRTTDGVDISSRTKRRNYMRAAGVTDASDFQGHWQHAHKEREAYRNGERVDPRAREAIGRAMYEHEKKGRR